MGRLANILPDVCTAFEKDQGNLEKEVNWNFTKFSNRKGRVLTLGEVTIPCIGTDWGPIGWKTAIQGGLKG